MRNTCSIYSVEENCTLGALRLVGGNETDNITLAGRVEACINGQWGTLCGDILFDRVGDSICGILGHSSQGTLLDIVYNSTRPFIKKEPKCSNF